MSTFIFSRIAWYNLYFPCIYKGSIYFSLEPYLDIS